MKHIKTIAYWILALVPLLVIFYALRNKITDWPSWLFVSLILLYAFVYRPLLEMIRLIDLKVIEKREAWKAYFFPFANLRYMGVVWGFTDYDPEKPILQVNNKQIRTLLMWMLVIAVLFALMFLVSI